MAAAQQPTSRPAKSTAPGSYRSGDTPTIAAGSRAARAVAAPAPVARATRGDPQGRHTAAPTYPRVPDAKPASAPSAAKRRQLRNA